MKNSDLIIEDATLLMIAAHYGSYAAVDSLIKKGCDITKKCSVGKSALDYFNLNIQRIEGFLSLDEVNLTRSKLDGSYKNGLWVTMYEKKQLENNVPEVTEDGANGRSQKNTALKI